MDSLIPQHIIDDLRVKEEGYLKKRLLEMNIQIKEEHLKFIVRKVQVEDDKNWFNYYLFYGDPKQIYLFSEKIDIVFENGISIKQELFEDELPFLNLNKN